MTHKIGIIGASGYTGAELIRLIETHPKMEVMALVGNTKAGSSMSDIFSHLSHTKLPNLTNFEETNFEEIDLCFCALPHKTSQEVIGQLPKNLKVIDLSADFRLRHATDYEKWYKETHVKPELQNMAIYGLTEFYREQIKGAKLIAGTGCNAALGQYLLRPLVGSNVIDFGDIILDMKCAVSGAGRAMREDLLHSEASEGIKAYAVGGTHRHLGEFDQELSLVAGQPIEIQFTPHLIPANRGVLATAYVTGNSEKIYNVLYSRYKEEPFIHVLPFGKTPSTQDVRGSNYCYIGVVGDRKHDKCIIIGVLDNLTKGSSGQAIQNANLMLNEKETLGLQMVPVFP
tara:strand:+ start:1413 stop:2441 length:1029 start_codon:yes stop_codon:yes gene_type:complete